MTRGESRLRAFRIADVPSETIDPAEGTLQTTPQIALSFIEDRFTTKIEHDAF